MHDHQHQQTNDVESGATRPAQRVHAAAHPQHDQAFAHAGHGNQHAGHSVARFARLFWTALILTVPVIFYSDLIQNLFGFTAPEFADSKLVAPIVASVIYWYTGWIFLSGAFAELRGRRCLWRE